jgi:hypothetical protein
LDFVDTPGTELAFVAEAAFEKGREVVCVDRDS